MKLKRYSLAWERKKLREVVKRLRDARGLVNNQARTKPEKIKRSDEIKIPKSLAIYYVRISPEKKTKKDRGRK